MRSRLTLISIVSVLILSLSVLAKPRMAEPYGYGSAKFDRFINDSAGVCNCGKPLHFYQWMSNAYNRSSVKFPGKSGSLTEALVSEKADLEAIRDPHAKAEAQMRVMAATHRVIKKVIPKFSLDRGFEFSFTVQNGERQCFLQSVLIAGMLQDMGIDAGVVMVFRNIKGDESNNGHAVTLARLADGRDIVVDASEPMPFPRHQGLFVENRGYRYVRPIYSANSDTIAYYRSVSNGARINNDKVKTLDYDFLLSQFDYYRGERVPGGIIATNKTKSGLRASASYLQQSVKHCPQNPLAVYMLGRTYSALGDESKARSQFRQAYRLYKSFGWMPGGLKEAMKPVK